MSNIIGDFNGDGCVNHDDLDILMAAFGSQEGDPNWNPACDLNGDGVVNIRDYSIFRRHLGEGCGSHLANPLPKD